MYKIEVPIPNTVHYMARTLNAFIDLCNKYREHIACLYFPLGTVHKGLEVYGIRAPEYVYRNGEFDEQAVLQWENALDQIMEFTGLPVKILCNNTYHPGFQDQDAVTKIISKLKWYASKYNVESVVIADPTLIRPLVLNDFKICLSTNSHNDFKELDMLFTVYGTDPFSSIVMQRDLNRNPKRMIGYLQQRGIFDRAILMVNEGCVMGCPYKSVGDVEISVSDVRTRQNKVHVQGCTALAQGQPWTFLTSPFLTHQMLADHYPDIRRIKLAGRDRNVSEIKRMLDHYINGTEHDLKVILNVSDPNSRATTHDLSKEWQREVMSCGKECWICKSCTTEYHDLQMRTSAREGEVNVQALIFYDQLAKNT